MAGGGRRVTLSGEQGRMWRTRLAGLGALAILGSLILALPTTPAGADSRCPNGLGPPGHVYSTGRWCDGTAANAILASLQSTPIWTYEDANDDKGFINNEFWVFTDNSGYSVYVETGIRQTNGYWLWWSDTQNSTYYNHYIQTVPANFSSYLYEIYYGYNGDWYLWSNIIGGSSGETYGFSAIQVGVYAWMWTLGMEENDCSQAYADKYPCTADQDWLNSPSGSPAQIDPDEWTGNAGGNQTFLNTLWVSPDHGTTWHMPADLDPDGRQLTYPCYPNTIGYCMNGTSYGSGQWAENIPG